MHENASLCISFRESRERVNILCSSFDSNRGDPRIQSCILDSYCILRGKPIFRSSHSNLCSCFPPRLYRRNRHESTLLLTTSHLFPQGIQHAGSRYLELRLDTDYRRGVHLLFVASLENVSKDERGG